MLLLRLGNVLGAGLAPRVAARAGAPHRNPGAQCLVSLDDGFDGLSAGGTDVFCAVHVLRVGRPRAVRFPPYVRVRPCRQPVVRGEGAGVEEASPGNRRRTSRTVGMCGTRPAGAPGDRAGSGAARSRRLRARGWSAGAGWRRPQLRRRVTNSASAGRLPAGSGSGTARDSSCNLARAARGRGAVALFPSEVVERDPAHRARERLHGCPRLGVGPGAGAGAVQDRRGLVPVEGTRSAVPGGPSAFTCSRRPGRSWHPGATLFRLRHELGHGLPSPKPRTVTRAPRPNAYPGGVPVPRRADTVTTCGNVTSSGRSRRSPGHRARPAPGPPPSSTPSPGS